METYRHSDVTNAIICCFYNVYNRLGFGFLERVYENALVIELKKRSIPVISQRPVSVFYEGELVGEYFADLFVDGKIIVEIKAARSLAQEHEAQLLNYLRATNLEVGLLLNFGPEPQVKRKVNTKTNQNTKP
jgi:GxxExxY protein